MRMWIRQRPGRSLLLACIVITLLDLKVGSDRVALMASIVVPCGDVTSLSMAIAAANTDPDLTTIEVGDACTYLIDAADNSDTDGATGLPAIISPIIIQGHGATIQSNGAALRVFKIDG